MYLFVLKNILYNVFLRVFIPVVIEVILWSEEGVYKVYNLEILR